MPLFLHFHSLPPLVAQHASAAVACHSGPPPRALLIADMSEPNLAPRLWAVDLANPSHPTLALQTQVAHGFGSDPGRTGMATRFSDVEGSGQTSLGLYSIGEAYIGKHGHSYRLLGLSPSNAHAYQRDVMLHPADYVSPSRVSYSAGCAAVSPSTLPALDHRFGTMTGALLWIDGPGVVAPSCAAARSMEHPWPVVAPAWVAALNSTSRSCNV
jgi:hypothetical protein